jgi:hypothetical protein
LLPLQHLLVGVGVAVVVAAVVAVVVATSVAVVWSLSFFVVDVAWAKVFSCLACAAYNAQKSTTGGLY